MYRQHFGIGEHPFSLTPDTQFFFNSENHCQILSTVFLALRHSEGFVKIVGEVGTGKTLLCRMLLAGLGDGFKTAYIPNPYLTPEELKWFLAEELGIIYSPDMPSYQLLKEINERLVALAEQQRQFVLVVDEAQAMPRETIEALRLLTNLETEKSKLLQVVLIGQPELDELLDRPDLRQLKQRIVFSEYLQGIPRKKIAEYIRYRLASAGYKGDSLLTESAIALLYRASGGVPRLINVIAHKSLLLAYGDKSERVTRAHVACAVASTQESFSLGRLLAKRRYWLWPSLMTAFCTSALLFGLAFSHTSNLKSFEWPSTAFNHPVSIKEISSSKKTEMRLPENAVTDEKPQIDTKFIGGSSLSTEAQLQRHLAELLLQAKRALVADKLTLPVDDNAFEYYKKMLALAPGNLQARVGFELIAARYLAKAKLQFNRGNSILAETFIERANFVAPDFMRQQPPLHSEPSAPSGESFSESIITSTDISRVQPAVKSEVIPPFHVTEAATISIVPNAARQDELVAKEARALIQQNKMAQAEDLLKRFIASETMPVQSTEALVSFYLQQGDVQAAEELLSKAHYVSPVEKAKMSAQLLTARGDNSAAIHTLEEHLSAADDNEQYSAFLASLYHKTGRYQQSVLSYQRLLKSYGEKPAYWLGLALAFDGLTQPDNALQAYQRLREFPQLQLPVKAYIDQRIAALRAY